MKKIDRLLKGHHYILFIDFEGCQYSHEIIAYGAVLVKLDKNGSIVKRKPPIKRYVIPKNAIGSYVTNLTGIDNDIINKEGILFNDAMLELKKYCGAAFKKCTFMTFGNNDLKMLNQSIAYNIKYPKQVTHQIQTNYCDFQAVLSEFIKAENGSNNISLVHYLEIFNIKEEGKAHDPLVDAVNLANLYQAFITKKDIVLNEYLKTLTRYQNLPEPIRKTVATLTSGKDVTNEQFINYVKDYLK